MFKHPLSLWFSQAQRLSFIQAPLHSLRQCWDGAVGSTQCDSSLPTLPFHTFPLLQHGPSSPWAGGSHTETTTCSAVVSSLVEILCSTMQHLYRHGVPSALSHSFSAPPPLSSIFCPLLFPLRHHQNRWGTHLRSVVDPLQNWLESIRSSPTSAPRSSPAERATAFWNRQPSLGYMGHHCENTRIPNTPQHHCFL